MIEPGIDKRVKVSEIIQGQLPSYVAIENPKSIDFLKQYYLSQDSQGLSADIIDNLDQYLKFDNLTPEVISGTTTLTANVTEDDSVFYVESTKGYPNKNGLFKVGNEIVYYTQITANSFTGCVRGFSGISDYSSGEVVFEKTSAESHTSGDTVTNLSALFLKEFFRNLKVIFAPGFEDESFSSDLNVNNFIKNLRSFYQSKGTEGSFNILMSCLFGENASITNNTNSLFSSSESEFRRRLFLVAEKISGGDPLLLSGQTLYQDSNSNNSNINGASAPISEVEYNSRDGKDYYNIYLFQKYVDPSPGFEGTFSITPETKCIGGASIGSNVLTVDTTIGFPKSGLLVVGNNTITYTDKTVNQFLNCSGIVQTIQTNDSVRTNDIIYGYTRGTNEKVELRLTGTISKFQEIEGKEITNTEINDVFRVKSVGRKIKNPSGNKTVSQITFNSWKYNTSSRIRIISFSGSVFVLGTNIDKAYLRNNDTVEVLFRGSDNIAVNEATVTITGDNEVVLSGTGISNLIPNANYDIRRKLKKSSSSGIELQYGNDTINANILNTYLSKDSNEIFVASNSLPDYEIDIETISRSINEASTGSGSIQDQNADGTYNIISFAGNVPFITGDEIVYTAGTAVTPIEGLEFGRNYFIEVLSPSNKIKLYVARSFIEASQNIKIDEPSDGDTGSHQFILASQYNKKINPQKLLKKFNLVRSFDTGSEIKTIPGPTGMLINGVEIINYKVDDKIYYGPLQEITLFNGGSGYDVVNPPKVNITSPSLVGATNAQANVAIVGSLQDILINPQDFNINGVSDISIVGGNGSGAEVEPILIDYFREVDFSGKYASDGGGVSVYQDSIRSINNHNFKNGEAIIYDPNGNPSIPITGFGQTNLTGNFLETGGVYYAEIIDSVSFRLYDTISDFNSGINTVGFSTGSISGGKHIFRLQDSTKKLTGVNVLNSGSGYSNREVAIKTTGISTITNSLRFESHGYNTGEIVTYSTTGDEIVGLSTANQYYVIKVDDDNFRLSDAGIGGTNTTNFDRGLVKKISGIGTGLHIFNYQPIEVNINVSIANTVGVITATPIVKGEVVDILVYEKGTDYGSDILNFEKKPGITILNGTGVEFIPLIIDGKIIDITVAQVGQNYFSPPDVIITSGSGFGAKARAVIDETGKVIDVIVLNPGTNYDPSDTFVIGQSRGSEATFNVKVRSLSLNNRTRFSEYNGETVFDRGENQLEYGIVGYNENLKTSFEDINVNAHSPLIGYAYDGNPIYGAYAYTDPEDSRSTIKQIESGYELDVSNIENRPSGFPSGTFVDDYVFKGSGDLDVHNGRFSKTPEYPNGVYAYYATIENDPLTGNIISSFPYFIGNTYRSTLLEENIIGSSVEINQDYEFNADGLIRNTFPYNVTEENAGYDFFTEPYKDELQRILVKSKKDGGVETISIIDPGTNYKVGDNIIFDNEGTGGGGASAEVLELTGNQVESITEEILSYENFTFERLNGNQIVGYISTYHDLEAGNIVKISGLSTFISGLSGDKVIGVAADNFTMLSEMPPEAVGGMVTDIPITPLPEYLRPNTDIQISDETLTVLNVFKSKNIFDNFRGIVRAVRGIAGSAHTVAVAITSKANNIIIDFPGDNFDSKVDDVYYFNPTEVIGFGTEVGVSTVRDYDILGVTTNRSILTQSIYIEDHKLRNNQLIKFVKTSSGNPVAVATVSAGSTFNLPESGNSQTLYVVNKSKNLIGLKTTLDSDQLFFSNSDSDSYEYYIETINNKITANIDRLSSRVSTASSHGLVVGDRVNISVKPNLSVGIGTSTSIKVLFEEFTQNLVVNPIGFTSSSVGLSSSKILVDGHGFITGDLVFYNADELPGGIETGKYFVYSGDPDSFSLAETISDITGNELNLLNFTSIGGTNHTISKVNPEIPVIKNNDLIFDLSDSSLSGYDFKVYYDQTFRNRIVGSGQSSIFEIEKEGTIGIGTTTATLTIKFNDLLPNQLYYNLEKVSTNTLIESDTFAKNYSRILFVDSAYSGRTSVVGVASTSFLVNLKKSAEKSSYTSSECDVLSYTTRSKTAFGGISDTRIISDGSDYVISPGISTVISAFGRDAELIASSSKIGILVSTEVQKSGYDFSVDKTLKPIADIPTYYELTDNKTLDEVMPLSGGKNYISAPNLVLVNSSTGKQVENASLICDIESGSIKDVEIISPGTGLAGVAHSVYALIGDNGLSVISADSVSTGIATFTVVTPVLGFSTNPLNPGDEVFVDGIQEYTGEGSGFNSKDYKFRFFNVLSFNGGIVPSTVTIDLSGISTNPGVAVTSVNFGSIVKKENYPTFSVTTKSARFINNETLIVVKGNNKIKTDLKVVLSDDFRLKTFGDYDLVVGDVIIGEVSGTQSTIERIVRYDGLYEVDYGSSIRYGWTDNRGFLNNDSQVIPDNDYYQRMAYSIKSPIEFEDFIDPVNRLAHISGTKNFADTQIESVAVASTNFVEEGAQSLVLDVFSEADVTTINNFDFAVDTDVVYDPFAITNSIKFGNRRLTNYIECLTNRVLVVDDISSEFIDFENTVGNFKDIIVYPSGTGASRFIVIVRDVVDVTSYEVHEVVVLTDSTPNSFILQKTRIKSNPQIQVTDELEKATLGEITSEVDDASGTVSLRFTPSNPLKTYDLKAFRQLFDSRPQARGSITIGDSVITGVTSTVPSSGSVDIVSVGSSTFNSFFAYVEITDVVTQERDYVEVSVVHDESNAYIAEYGFNTEDRLLSFNPIGTFGTEYDQSSDVFALNYTNNLTNQVTLKANVVGFKTTNVGLRSEFFKLETQDGGSERTARLESNVIEETVAGYGITVVGISSLNDRVAKSIVRVSSGNTQSMSQVMMTQDFGTIESFVVEYPQVGINTAIGFGTFSSEFDGNFVKLIFNPDSKFNGDAIRIEEFTEIVYIDQDTNVLSIPDFGYGSVIENVVQSRYTPNAKLEFDLEYEGFPIFARRFNPQNPTILDPITGNIFIESHFLQSGQEIVYTPGSSIIGVNSESIGIGTTISGGDSVIGDIFVDSKIVSSASTNIGLSVSEEFFGPGIGAGATIVSIGSTFRFFIGNSDGTNVITSVANTSVLAIGDTIVELSSETGFGTITSIGINSISVDNNVPVGVGSTYYSERLGIGISLSVVSTANTSRQQFTSGITTDILPSNLFAIRVDNNNIKLATKKDFALRGIGIEPTTTGSGNNHLIDTTKKLEKSLFVLDGVVQAPIARTLVEYETQIDVGIGLSYIPLSGISTLVPDYILRIDDEFMNILNVGFGTSSSGPIGGGGTFPLVNVQRGFVGTEETDHADGTIAIVHRGAYNIVESKVHFVDAPKGAGGDFILDERGLEYTRSDFNGRVYLKQDYSTNEIYDDVSPDFTGIAKTFSLTVANQYPVGLDTSSGSGVLFINGIHQGQTTDNNPSNVYELNPTSDKVNVEFSGVKLLSGDPFISESDAILNKLPVGGRIVSIASSGGTGIAPLVGAKVIAEVGAGGTITNIVGVDTVGTYSTITDFVYDGISGIATVTTLEAHGLVSDDFVSMRDIDLDCTSGYDSLVSISAIDYDHISGIMTVTTSDDHYLNKDMRVKFRDIEFECSKGDFDTTYSIIDATYDETTGTLNVTTSSTHDLNVGMTIRLSDIEFSCAAAHAGVTTTIFPDGTNGRIFNEVTSVVSDTEFVVNVGISTIEHTYQSGGLVEVGITTTKFPSDLGVERAISAATYTESTGALSLTTRRNHNVSTGDIVRLTGLEFSCAAPHAGVTTTIFPDTVVDEFEVTGVTDPTTFEVNVGVSTIAHTFVSANRRGFMINVKYADSYLVQSVVGPTTFVTNVLPVGFAHTYVSGGVVETGFTTTRFPDPRGIPFAIGNFEYDKTTGFSTITTKKNHSGLAIGDQINLSGIAFTCLAYGNEIAIYDFDYTASTGVSTILVNEDHGLTDGDLVMLRDIEFSCAAPHAGVTTTIFPDGTQGFYFNVNAGSAGTTIVTNVGISTIDHTYVSGTGKIRIGITTSIFPDGTQGNTFKIFDIPASNQIITNVGISTIDHIYDDHGIVFGVKAANPYNVKTIKSPTEFEVDVFKVGFAHTYVPSRRFGVASGEVAKFNQGLTFGSGYFGSAQVSIEEDGHTGAAATITANINEGGSLSFNIVGEGSGYTNPTINVSDPSYANLPIEGISRIGLGSTTDSGKGLTVSVNVGPGATTGIGTTSFAITNFTISNPGFAFLRGDVFRPVGLVTAAGVGTNYSEFTLEVLNVLNDTFSAWNFGQIDYIDSIRSLQDGFRTRFPLNLNGNGLSFQRDITDQQSVEIDLDAVLLIFVNGVVQVPRRDYFFEGGTSFNFNFTSAPRPEDEISIYFYRGTRGVDSQLVTVYETVKPGDKVQMLKSNSGNIQTQDERTIFSIIDSTDIETNVYRNRGINDIQFRPISFTRQKRDIIISEEIQFKSRDSLESQIMPVGKIIGNFGASDTEIFLDDAKFFQYEEDADGSNFGEIVCDGLIVDYNDPVSAAVSAVVSSSGTISSLVINDGGSGYYDGSVSIKISSPQKVDNEKYGIIGVGTTATATATAVNGVLDSVTIVNPGFGYTVTNPPQVIVEVPSPITDTITGAEIVLGYSGIITGISTANGSGGHPLALQFQVDLSDSGPVSLFRTLLPGYPIVVKNTVTGTGVTSVDSSDSEVIGIGSTHVDNIYIVHEYSVTGNTGIMTCNIKSDTDTVGIATTTGFDVGQFSWGKLSEFSRSNSPISLTVYGNTFDVGLTTYPSITRRGVGLRNTGNVAKQVLL